MKTRRFRAGVFLARSKVIGGRRRYAWGLGVKVGYWPCPAAPYVQLSVGRYRPTVWYGGELPKEKQ